MTKFRAWKVAELVAAAQGLRDKHIIIPAFQRSFVWNATQRLSLIDSIRQGFPIGCLLLFHVGYDGNQEKLQLVDGLQRTVTLQRYFSNVFEHAVIDDLPDHQCDVVRSFCTEVLTLNALTLLILTWIRSRRSFSASDGYTNVELWMSLLESSALKDSAPDSKLMISLQQILDDVRLKLDISGYEIPVIEFFGNADDLPAIFDKVNTGGTKLAKYDILAAAWNDQHLSITDGDLIAAIKSKYRELIALGLELDRSAIQTSDNGNSSEDYLIFEFVFAVGRCLKVRFPKLYGRLREATTEVESIGFSLVTLCSGLRLAQLGGFATIIAQHTPDLYYAALVEASDFVYSALGDILDFPLDRESARKTLHSELQIASLVASVFRLMFTETLERHKDWNRSAETIAKQLRQHYLYDQLRRYWRSSGDSKAYLFISGLTLLTPVNISSFMTALDAWFAESLRGRAQDVNAIMRSIIKLLCSNKLRNVLDRGRKFQIALLYSAEELRGSGIVPLNIANVVVVNPESGRRADPSNLSARREPNPNLDGFEYIFNERFQSLKSKLVEIVF